MDALFADNRYKLLIKDSFWKFLPLKYQSQLQ